jgi:hypothetical protein
MDVILNRLLDEKCKELGLSKAQGLEIFKSVSKFVAHTMQEGNYDDLESFKSVYVKNLGVFYPNINVVKNINKKRKKDENI